MQNRPIKIQVSSAASPADATLAAAMNLLSVDMNGQPLKLGPLSVEVGFAIFNGKREVQITVTAHEATPTLALEIWHRLRGLPGVYCGRIYDRGLSWCAKSYENVHGKRFSNGSYRWPDHTFDPVKVTA
jgi:hypothetical protein